MFPLTYQLAQVLSLILAGLANLKRQVSGDLALLGGRIIDPAFLLPVAQESYLTTAAAKTATFEQHLSTCSDLSTFVQTTELALYYDVTPWPAYKEYLDPVEPTLSSCTDVSTFIQTTDLQPYNGFTPWPAYRDYLPMDPDPGIEKIRDQSDASPVREPISNSILHLLDNNTGFHTLAAFSFNSTYNLPTNTKINNTSVYASNLYTQVDKILQHPLGPFYNDLPSASSGITDVLNIMSISKLGILPVTNSSSVLAHTTIPCNTVANSTVSNGLLASQPGRLMQGGLLARLEHPSGSDLCIITVVYILGLFTFLVLYTHTAEIRSSATSLVVIVSCFSVKCYSVSHLVISFFLARRRILAPKLRSGLFSLARLSLLLIIRAIIYYIEATTPPTGVPAPHAVNIRHWRLKRTKCGSVKKRGARKALAAAAAADRDASIPDSPVVAEEQVVPASPVTDKIAVGRVPAGFVPATNTIAIKKTVVRRAKISGPRWFW